MRDTVFAKSVIPGKSTLERQPADIFSYIRILGDAVQAYPIAFRQNDQVIESLKRLSLLLALTHRLD